MLWLLAFIIGIRVTKADTSETFLGHDTDKDVKPVDDRSKWRAIRNEVFTTPSYSNFLSAAAGSGVQLTLIVILLCFIGSAGTYYASRGSLYTVAVVIYSLTASKAPFSFNFLMKFPYKKSFLEWSHQESTNSLEGNSGRSISSSRPVFSQYT